MKRYFAKVDSWFKEGSEAFFIEETWPDGSLSDGKGNKTGAGVFRGTYIVGSCGEGGYDHLWYGKGYKDGDEVEMHEDCCYDEFDVVEE